MKQIGLLKNKLMVLFYMFMGVCMSLNAQTENASIRISYSDGKDLLLSQNLNLLAEYYNIEIATAEIEQAKLWNNPLFVWNAEMYSMAQNRYFNFNNQKLIQLEYAFSFSGKRINAIRQANLGKEIAELAFSDVMRGMVSEFSNLYFSLNALSEKERIYLVILDQFENVIELSKLKENLGVVSESDVLRLRTEYLSLQSVLNGIRNERYQIEAQVKSLLNLPSDVRIETTRVNFGMLGDLPIGALIDSAKIYRPDYLIAERNLSLSELVYKGEKKEAYPMINLGYQPLDQGSNHVRPYVGMVFEMSVPIFDRNQGNIHSAKVGIEQKKYQLEYARKDLENNVVSKYLQLKNTKGIYDQYTEAMRLEMNELSENARLNFDKRNISLVEYIDFQRAYIDYQMNWIEATSNYFQSINQIHFAVGKEIQF
jgi:cobalt-zinc-cadmium efflux system outer membrane protein